ncbi:calcium-binding protein [Herbaspirillum sp. alder98]|uniref:calcium-binding protein n=1 Tax=Herbaspirillum sp. alder98 TaxID=2913096 RepID=UPI001CD85F5F|nr:calcium-binding protein [Herbaspirillum sp. alder98]MCA1326539.1 hypothetical protein [Herbaspirillum sp. alder98]
MENQQQGQTQPDPVNQEGSQTPTPQSPTDEQQASVQAGSATVSRASQQVGTDAADILVGRSGRERLVGGKGDDTYIVDDEDTAIQEKQGEGWDTIRASVSFKLSRHVERLELTGHANLNGMGNSGNDRLIGNAGNNVLSGFKGNDSIDGGAGDDTLTGDRGNDRLVGGPGDDDLDGGFGNDVLIGGTGNDTYELRRAMGQDYVYDDDFTHGNADTIRVTTALTPADIEVLRDGDDLLLRIRRTTSGLRVGNWFRAPRYRVEQVRFDDGTTWDIAAIEAQAAQHQAEPTDLPFGRGWGTTIRQQQQAGAQGLEDPSGQRKSRDSIFGYGTPVLDTVTMRRSVQVDLISPAPLWTQSVDMIKIDARILPADLMLMRDHDDLILQVAGSEPGCLRVRRGFDRAQIEFADGTRWSNAAIREALRLKLRDGRVVHRSLSELAISGGAFYGYDDSADVLEGSRDGDQMFGLGGDDIINGHDGRDRMYGGPGNDRMAGGQHADIMHGGSGNDVMDGGRGPDYMDGGAGDDILTGGRGDDVIDGGGGDDRIDGGRGNDVLHGGLGCDLIHGGDGNDLLYGGAGADTYYLDIGMGFDIVDEGGGPDRGGNIIEVAAELRQTDITLARVGHHLVLGSDDLLSRLTLKNLFDGGQAYIEAINFVDGSRWSFPELERRSIAVNATAGDDILHGRGGAKWWQGDDLDADIHDVLNGRGGADQLWGHAGNDLLEGGQGDDTLTGGDGCDLLAGGGGRDRLVRGRQGDVIVFNRGDGHDTLAFDAGPGAAAATAGGPTLSLGGVRLDQLALRKSGLDLVLELDSGDSISVENWYGDAAQVRGTLLQLVLDSTDDYQADADDIARQHKIALYDFNGIAEQYDRARNDLPGLDLWSVSAALAHHRLRGSDTLAIGGELAYHYAHHGQWSQLGAGILSATLVNPLFGNSDQAIARAGATAVLAVA